MYDWIAARSMSPVAMCGILKTADSRTACVPFPAPGGPNNRRFSLKFYRPLLRLLSVPTAPVPRPPRPRMRGPWAR